MQTDLADFIRHTPEGDEADRILRACVHCGFCTATCPTYQLLGDELDGPRGRIYQIKQVLEGQPATETVRTHLDRCLTCRACETTCPSGVDYHRLLDIGRAEVARQVPRSRLANLQRRLMIETMAYRGRFTPLLRIGQALRPLMPRVLRSKVPPRQPLPRAAPGATPSRRVIALGGYVQPGLAPEINAALARVLGHLGVAIVSAPGAGCCGALPHHLDDTARAQSMARRNLDAWLPLLDDGAEALLVTASGCGAQLQDYPHLFATDDPYHAKAERLAAVAVDPAAFLAGLELERLPLRPRADRVAVHTPCTLQHALHLNGAIEKILRRLGYAVVNVAEGHLCCGSAGTYSILQADLSQRLRTRKLEALHVEDPAVIVTANIGCLLHLADEGGTPVMHWLNLVAADL
jgi:glycolate oxidase iron-sulfur subunit